MASPVFKTGATRPRRVGWVRFPHVPAIALAALLVGIAPLPAQEPDTLPAPAAQPQLPPRQNDVRAPLSPGGAFLRSVLVPGWAQHVLDRPRAGALFVATEFLSLAMMIDARQRLSLARQWGRDTMIVGWEPPLVPGDPPRPIIREGPLAGRIAPRRQEVEDWTAILLFNHLLAGAEAFVAAHLWEIPIQLEMRHDGVETRIGLRIPWQP